MDLAISNAAATGFKEHREKWGEIICVFEYGKRKWQIQCCFCMMKFCEWENFISHTSDHQNQFQKDSRVINESSVASKEEQEDIDVDEQQWESGDEEFIDETRDPLEELSSSPDDQAVGSNIQEDDVETVEDGSESDIDMDANNFDIDFMNRKFTLALISGYEKHRVLWDTKELRGKKGKEYYEAYEKIATSLNAEMGMKLKATDIKERLTALRTAFRNEVKKKRHSELNGNSYVPIWYFDHLSFIGETIKRRNKRGTKALTERPALPIPSLTDAQNLALIEMYKSFPCLWDFEHADYRMKNKREAALVSLLETIHSELKLDIGRADLQRKIYRIRYACTQEKYRKMQCEQEGCEFSPLCKYYEQISFLKDRIGPFQCPYCEEIFYGVDQFLIHRSKHDGSMPFTCPLCQRGFMKVGNCTVHMRRHTRDYHLECDVCGKRFATSTDVTVHKRYHTGEKPYICEVCGQTFRTWTLFDTHQRRHQKRPRHKCTICSKTFYEHNKLNEHMKAHMNVRDKVCPICGKAFTATKYLRQHRQIHDKEKKYACKICGKNFAQHSGLSGHMKSHATIANAGTTTTEEN